MEFREAVDELQENIRQIKRQHRLQRLRRFLKFFLIGFLIGRDSDKRMAEFRARNNSITKSIGERIKQRECTIREQVEAITHSGTYLTYNKREQSLKAIISFEEDLSYCDKNDVLERGIIEAKRKKLKHHFQTISNYNKKFIEQRKKDYTHLWTKGLLSLDDEQQTAIITDDKHNLVVAAAGSGKTEVLITRIAYLIARKPDHVKPKRILAIAYQRKAKEEIEQRLRDRFNIKNVNARTFHKLGKDILEETGREFTRTDIVDGNKKHEVIQKIFDNKIRNETDFYKLFLQFVKTLHDKETKEKGISRERSLALVVVERTC